MSLRGERILVTGGAGFIGRRLCRLLARDGRRIRSLDNLHPQIHAPGSAVPAPEDGGVEWMTGDVRDEDALRKALSGVEAVVHLAAETGMGQSQYEIARYVSVNVQGLANLLDLAARLHLPLRRLVVASSARVYGEGA